MKKSKSLIILENKVNSYFQRKDQKCTIICDNCDLEWSNSKTINLVFFGNALTDLQYLRFLPRKSYFTIWVLCNEFRRLLNEFYDLPLESIRVINRYDLFPKKDVKRIIIDSVNDWVISSRPSTLKNIDLSLKLINYLGEIKNKTLNVEVCAPNFNIVDFERYSKDLNYLNIIFRGDLGADWVDSIQRIDQKALIQFSFYPKDDFSVSVAQWQQEGGALLVADTVACKDVYGVNVFKIKFHHLLACKKYMNDKQILSKTLAKIYRDDDDKIFENKEIGTPISNKMLLNKISSISNDKIEKIKELNSFNLNSSIIKVLNEN